MHYCGGSGVSGLTASARLLLVGAVLMLAACAGVPFDYPKTVSHAIPTHPDTALGATGLAWRKKNEDMSWVVGMPQGIDALGTRMRLMEQAQHSIDAQYFIVKRDAAGALFTTKMLRAADRGVRVRLLVDDIFSPGVDQAFSLLNSHPNVQVRLFNPLSRQGFKYWDYLTSFERANRRMHNKSFTVDGTFSIVGGRNIGEEYFELNQDVAFDDYEVLTLGAVVEQISAGFDQFWNSELSVPMEAFAVEVDHEDLERWRAFIETEMALGDAGIYGQAINSPLLQKLRDGTLEPIPAKATMITDSPEKLLSKVGDAEYATLAIETLKRLQAAQEQVVIITPYFIPQERASTVLEALLARGVRVIIITNSLASTNHVPVYAGYARYRDRLLQAGAEFYEIRAQGTVTRNAWGMHPERSTLHSKMTIFDHKTVFIGSLNFDPRSLLINSEMGLFIDTELGVSRLRESIEQELPRVSYRVDLDEASNTRWTYQYEDEFVVLDKSPQTSWWRRFSAGFIGLLPLEDQL